MSQGPLQEVFTAAEVARAAGVPRGAVQALIDSGEVPTVAGTRFVTVEDAVNLGRRLRADAATRPVVAEPLFAGVSVASGFANRRRSVHALASSVVHAALLVVVLWWTSGPTETAEVVEPVQEKARLVFLVKPGPGGGGGGGGMRNPLPARRVERRGPQRARVTVPETKPEKVLTTARRVEEPPRPTPAAVPEPKPIERAPEPLPSRVLVAPVVAAAANDREKDGAIEKARDSGESQGPGVGGGAGTGQGTGSGEGRGSGIGDGSGGGTGGGPFRPGSGIEPPRLIREVKADYTEDARRRAITGDVVLEIVVRRDGSVGDVRLLQGLGAGLDQRAMAAVRQWRFTPARRRGEPVDVIVEVAVEFTLR
jgi:TonB family protein